MTNECLVTMTMQDGWSQSITINCDINDSNSIDMVTNSLVDYTLSAKKIGVKITFNIPPQVMEALKVKLSNITCEYTERRMQFSSQAAKDRYFDGELSKSIKNRKNL